MALISLWRIFGCVMPSSSRSFEERFWKTSMSISCSAKIFWYFRVILKSSRTLRTSYIIKAMLDWLMLRACVQGFSVFRVPKYIIKIKKNQGGPKSGKKHRENLSTRFSTILNFCKKVTLKRRLEKSDSLIYRSHLFKQTSSRSNSCIVGVSVEEVFELKIGQKFFSGIFSDKEVPNQSHGRDLPYIFKNFDRFYERQS